MTARVNQVKFHPGWLAWAVAVVLFLGSAPARAQGEYHGSSSDFALHYNGVRYAHVAHVTLIESADGHPDALTATLPNPDDPHPVKMDLRFLAEHRFEFILFDPTIFRILGKFDERGSETNRVFTVSRDTNNGGHQILSLVVEVHQQSANTVHVAVRFHFESLRPNGNDRSLPTILGMQATLHRP